MRHTELKNREAFDVVAAPDARLPASVNPKPSAAAPDMPKAAGILMILAYAMLMGAFVVTIHGARADFAITIAVFYVAMFFGVPAVFLGMERDRTRRPDLIQFLDRGIDTATGHISGAGALVQMLLVPVLLAFGVLAMGITYLLV
jgi:hypothetical protein